jgi:hypothetical protein
VDAKAMPEDARSAAQATSIAAIDPNKPMWVPSKVSPEPPPCHLSIPI